MTKDWIFIYSGLYRNKVHIDDQQTIRTGAEMNRCLIDEQDKTAEEYARWLNKNNFLEKWIKFWLFPKAVLLFNTQAWKLPTALSLKPLDKVLDIGCGYGSLLIYLYKRVGFREVMQGIDVSQVMVNLAEKEIEGRALESKIKAHTGKATDLPYPDGTFNIVLSTYVIKHLSDKSLLKMMKEVKRVLKTGGKFCFWDVGPSMFKGHTNFYKRLLSLEVSTINLRSSDEIRRIMEETGFGDIKPFGHGFYFFYPFMPRVGFIGRKS